MSNDLTGYTRLRRGLFGKVVLQVEEKYVHTENCLSYIHCETRTRWRDASFEDLTLNDGKQFIIRVQK